MNLLEDVKVCENNRIYTKKNIEIETILELKKIGF